MENVQGKRVYNFLLKNFFIKTSKSYTFLILFEFREFKNVKRSVGVQFARSI